MVLIGAGLLGTCRPGRCSHTADLQVCHNGPWTHINAVAIMAVTHAALIGAKARRAHKRMDQVVSLRDGRRHNRPKQ
eukprot:12413136-Karenia_brevis.AAC.1